MLGITPARNTVFTPLFGSFGVERKVSSSITLDEWS